ncbi:hypothetical protein [Cecembia lonarensis]|uniref:Uncharacterized protein n=1 Tax=Cecembia lonarensis (strain CCUG 58316 / KCTC 22772 / LW9) TaxID=1225176 RepID=K1L5H1_CECL9|nr:hypothetical protein [Cecembia lonarensis]EKB47252.1 hypothetical protein B879_04152 [Cecembia lonarensis LW9]
MSKNPNATSSSVKATRQGKDTKKRLITLKASMIGLGIVYISLWDKDFEIGSIVCPVEIYGLNDCFYEALNQILMGYSKSIEYKAMQKRDRRGRK